LILLLILLLILILLLLPPLTLRLILLLLLRGPSAAAGSAGKYPKGATHGCVAFADGTGCPIRESRPNLRTRSAQRGGRAGGVCFLLVTFLCTSKEK
jgi:hypothetical protein